MDAKDATVYLRDLLRFVRQTRPDLEFTDDSTAYDLVPGFCIENPKWAEVVIDSAVVVITGADFEHRIQASAPDARAQVLAIVNRLWPRDTGTKLKMR